eukprot:CAMPEP_0172302920 /NCGR_PEP_ID=MMETSP1058-20130122/4558_1 /TAXON_ID=83371 /ORGANISM="Detonula confervacea, Strain CCMP 353" /LENGTH=529 /DNA_ID=CAMNT_0013013577 /DNA_START=40 /DNA_END=1629 /DNA_ORIENTATION=-
MESSKTDSPSSVATPLMMDHIPAMDKLKPHMHCAQSERIVPPFARSNSMPDDGANNANDDIDSNNRRRSMTVNFCYNNSLSVSISAQTRRILEKMDDSQVQNAKEAFAAVKEQRMACVLITKRPSSQPLSKMMEEGDEKIDDDVAVDALKDDSNNDDGQRGSAASGSSVGDTASPARQFSKSMGPLDSDETDDFSEDEDDDEEGTNSDEGLQQKIDRVANLDSESKKKQAMAIEDKRAERGLSQSMGAMGGFGNDYDSFDELSDEDEDDGKGEKELPLINRSIGQLKEVDEITGDTLEQLFSGDDNNSMPHVPQPISTRRRPTRQRRAGIMSQSCSAATAPKSHWKPLSSYQHDPSPEDEDAKDAQDEEENAPKKGIGGFWNKLSTAFKAEGSACFLKQVVPSKEPSSPTKTKKEVNSATYFRRGKKKANKCQFLQAVALFNFALVRQREELGENHIDCGTTLNEIGVCWMMVGERYPALTAFEEALFIRQKHFGDGAMEVAEITNNIWMILHEERSEIENMMEEEEED